MICSREGQNAATAERPSNQMVAALHPSEPSLEFVSLTRQAKGFKSRLATMKLMITTLYDHM